MPELSMSELAGRWRELHDARAECEAAAKSLKEAEDAAAEAILARLAESGMRSAGIPGVGTVAKKVNLRVHLTDHQLMAGFMLKRLSEAAMAGKPLVDHLVLQKAAAQSEMLDWARGRLAEGEDPDNPDALNRVLGPVGFAARAVESLTFSKERGK